MLVFCESVRRITMLESLLTISHGFANHEYLAFLEKAKAWDAKITIPPGNDNIRDLLPVPVIGKYIFFKVPKEKASGRYLWGTPWGTWFTFDSSVLLTTAHACSSQEDWEFLSANELWVMARIDYDQMISSYTGLVRNGVTGINYGTNFWRGVCLDFVYYSKTKGKMVRTTPRLKRELKDWDGEFIVNLDINFDGSYASFLELLSVQNNYRISGASSLYQESSIPDGNLLFNQLGSGGTMWGTPYKDFATYDSTWWRILQHAFPDEATFNSVFAAKTKVLTVLKTMTGKSSHVSLARNGYTSTAFGSYPKSVQFTKVIYKSPTEDRMMVYEPLTDNPPSYWDGVF